jgi:hypothetical protein
MKNIIENKKAQSLGGLYSGILFITAIGILLALVMYILSSMGTSFLTPNTAGSVVNESILRPTTAGISLAASRQTGAVCEAITNIWNGTTGVAIGLNMLSQSGCIVYNTTAVNTSSTWVVSYPYTYSASTASSNATSSIVDDFIAFLPWLGIILLALAAGVVLFFIIRSFSGAGKGV